MAQTDALNDDVQLAFDNIVIIFCPYSYTGDAKGHIEVQTTGSGEGYYINRGKAVPITWSRTEHDVPMTLLTANGTALEMNPGKTFVCVMNSARKADVTFG